MTYVALLRGIGPTNPNMRGERLRYAFEKLGFKKVSTVINSGNVVFDSPSKNAGALEARIEKGLPRLLGFKSSTIIRSKVELERLEKDPPFAGTRDDPRRYHTVTFLKHAPEKPHGLEREGKGYTFFGLKDRAVFISVDIKNAKTPDVMRFLEKKFGKEITTRTWKTVKRILKKMEAPAASR